MKANPSRHCAVAVLTLCGALTLASTPSARSEAIPGDFEAKVVLRQDENPVSLPISVSISVASPTAAAPKFSGRVSSGTLTQAITGTLSAPTADDGAPGTLVATVSNLKQIPPFTVRYTPPSPASEFDAGTPDSMVLLFGNYGEFFARAATTLSPNSEGNQWTLTDAFAGALKVGEGAFDVLDSKIDWINGRVASGAELIAAGSSELSGLRLELKTAQAEFAVAKKAVDTLAKQVVNLKKAESGMLAASQSLEKAVDTSVTAFAEVILKNVPDIDSVASSEQAKQVFEEFTGNFLLSTLQAEDGNAQLTAFSNALASLLSKTTLETFEEALFEMPFSLPFFYENLSQAKALWTSFKAQTTTLISGAKAVYTAQNAYAAELDKVAPEVLNEVEAADADLQRAAEAVDQAASLIAQKVSEIAGLRSELDSLTSLKATYTQAKLLTGFAGYGTFQAGIQAASSTASKPTAITAAFLGTTPDGQKFTYSAKLRAEDPTSSSGVFFLNAVAGKRAIVSDVNYAVDYDSASATSTASEDLPVWAGLDLQQTVGAALLPAKVTDDSREDFERAMNVFGGPVDESGNISISKTAVSSVVVAVGERQENGAVSGFGAQINSANAATKLLVAKKGSALKLTPSAVTAASFTGAFPYNGAVAKPFTGVFFRVDGGDSGPEVRGFGSLVASPTASVPVEIFVSSGSEEGQQPAALEAPSQPLVLWNGLSGGNISFQVTDMPAGLNVTTVRLFKGTKLVGSAEAAADGRVLLPTKGLAAGADYTIQVSREFVSGVFDSEPSSEFEISTRSLPVYTYQTLLGPGEDRFAKNGMTHQGRLTVTTTATGAWTGKLEWVSLTQAVDSTGQPSSYTFSSPQGDIPVYIPAIVSYPLKGQLVVPSDSQDVSELRSTITVPVKGQPGHQLVVSIVDGSTDGPLFGPLPTTPVGLRLNATLDLDPSFEEENSQYGEAYPSVKGVAAAKGKYSTVSLGEEGEAKNNHSHTIDYAGAATAVYTFQTGTGAAKLTSTANVGLDGSMPFLVGGVLAKSSLRYQNAFGASVTAPMAIVVAGVTNPTIGLSDIDNKYWVAETPLHGGGCELEVSAKSKGGYVLRDEWVNEMPSNGEYWGIGNGIGRIAATKRFVDFLAEEKLAADTPYTFELVIDDSPVLTDTITFNKSGVATFSDTTNKSFVTLSATLSTGAAKASVKLSNGELSPTGKAVTVTGFAMPSNPLLGWGGIEGGDVGWRIRAQ